MWRLHRIGIVGVTVLLALVGCASGRSPSDRPVVVVSVPPQAYFVERIAGDLVEIEVMIPPGASPATFEPSMRQMLAVSRAALYVQVGHPHFPFERAWLDRLIAGNPGMAVVNGSQGSSCLEDDPHVWVSPGSVRGMARNIEAALEALLPGSRAELRRNLQAFQGEIDRLDAEIRVALADRAGGTLLVFHPAWGCFTAEYGLVQLAIEHDGKDPTPAALARLIDRARADRIPVLFVQPQFAQGNARQIAAEIGAEVVVVDPLARDWPAAMRAASSAFARALRPAAVKVETSTAPSR